MYVKTTKAIRITARPIFLEDKSIPEEMKFFWAYQITIKNTGKETVCLKSRYWQITDSYGRVLEVKGEGVVGLQPVLKPGEMFEYTSGTPLSAPSGVMVGKYEMETLPSGQVFWTDIPPFSLDSPHQLKLLH
jgi:ApaG protein